MLHVLYSEKSTKKTLMYKYKLFFDFDDDLCVVVRGS